MGLVPNPVSICYIRPMNERIKELTEEARRLSPSDRAQLVESVLESLDATDRRLDQLWLDESSDRRAAYRRGEVDAIDLEDVIAKHRPDGS